MSEKRLSPATLRAHAQRQRHGTSQRARGQALIEYALIVSLVVFAIVLILTLTGPAVGNVFSNTVFNLLNQTTTPRPTLSDAEFWDMATSVASITPQSVDVRTNTPAARADQPPVARTDNYNMVTATSMTLAVNAAGGVLANDTDVNTPPAVPLAIASNTQPTCSAPGTCGTVTVNSDGSFVYTAGTFTGGFVSFTYVVQNTLALTATGLVNIGVDMTGSPPETTTPTPQPSATPVDLEQAYPFYDGADTASSSQIWHTGFTNVVHGPWKVDYFNNLALAAPAAATESRFWRPGGETLNMNWGMSSPLLPAGVGPGNYSVRFSKTTPFDIEYRRYELHLDTDGQAQVIINGSPVISIPAGGGSQTVYYTPPAPVAPATSSPVTIEITYIHTTGTARLRFAMNNFVDIGQCNWRMSAGVYRSEFNAWQDSPGNTDYQVTSDCHLRLRGYIDIPSGASEAPRLFFWERWALSATATMQLGIREYNATSDWTWVNVHGPTAGTNANWRRQEYDLTSFGPSNTDYRGRRIEFAFRLANPSDTLRADGWYIDDISVQDSAPNVFNIGFRDDAETAISSQLWINECNWRRVVNEHHAGIYSWTDSPTGNYANGDNCALTLNGVFDLTPLPVGDPDEPEVTFWSKYSLTSTTDQIVAEWRPENSTNEADWAALAVTGSLDPYIARASSNSAWTKYYVNLANQPAQPDLRGQKIQFRFRLVADNDQTADGWYIDDIELRVRPLDAVGVPFYEPFDSADRWLLGGAWGLSQVVPPATAPSAYSPTTALTDSPTGNYTASVNTTAILIPSVNLLGTTKPVMTFWTHWKASQANLYLELSTDGGATWPTRLWENTGPEKVQLAWQRFKLDLSAYNTASISLRFRLQDVGGSPDDGWFVDDIRIEEDDTASVTIGASEILEDLESASAADEWYVGGDWAIRDDGGRLDFAGVAAGQPGLPSRGFVDSPSGNYAKPARSILEYVRSIDLAGTTSPTLSFFTTYELGDTLDKLLVEVSTDNGFNWVSTPLWQNPGRVNLGWHRVLVDLSAYQATPIRIRFRLETMNSGLSSTGWALDDFRVYDRALAPDLGSTFDDPFNDLSRWVTEGKWVSAPTTAAPDSIYGGWEFRTSSLRPVTFSHSAGGSYPTINTSNWVGDYWHVAASDTAVWTGSTPTWPSGAPNIGNDTAPPEIVFDYAADPVNQPFNSLITDWAVGGTANNEYYLMRWTRRYQADRSATYRFRLTFSGGAQLYIKAAGDSWGSPLTPATLERPFVTTTARNASNPWQTDADSGSYYYTYTMSAGQSYDIRVEYYHTTDGLSGPGRVELRQSEPSSVARTAPGNVATDTYAGLHRTSLILNGNLTIPANTIGVVGFQERYSLTDTDYGRFYYSLNGGGTWTQILEHAPNNPSGGGFVAGQFGTDWTDRSYDIQGTNGDGTFATEGKVTFKFELNTLGNLGTLDEGWLLDNFEFYTRTTTVNAAPTAATASIAGTTSISTSSSPFCVTPNVSDTPGDTHTFTILTAPPRGDAWVQSSQLCYRPPVDWTGTTAFTFRATDLGGESVVGSATVTIEPYFFGGVNVNGPSLVVSGHTFYAWSGTGVSLNATAGSDPTLVPGGTSGTLTTMLQTWMEWNGLSNGMRVGAGPLSAADAGIYTGYVYVVEDDTTAQTYDVYLRETEWSVRLQNDYNSGTRGSWQKLGPFTVRVSSYDVSQGYAAFWFRGDADTAALNTAKVAAIEFWRGGDTSDWTSGDLGGYDTNEGSFSGGGNAVTLTAYGADFWGAADQGQFAWFAERGDVEIISRVRWIGSAADGWAKAGVMIREWDDEGARMANVVLTWANNIYMQYRSTEDGSAANGGASGGVTETNPQWVRLTRVGNVFTGYYSTMSGTPTDSDWTQIGQVTIGMSNNYLIGVALTSHNNSVASTASFDNIIIRPYTP